VSPLRGIISNLRDRIGNVKPERFCVLRSCVGGGRDTLVFLMSDARRFPPPWSVDELEACFVVKDSAGQKLTPTVPCFDATALDPRKAARSAV
jgi:hypothetical protein